MAAMATATPEPDLTALDYVPLIPYNETIMTGGDSLAQNLNVYYEVGSHPFLASIQTNIALSVWRHSMDYYFHSACASHDSRRWVSSQELSLPSLILNAK